ncbi:MAG: hypothetical protein ABL949_17070 [Fimbriimonadaceae bacterium]
MKTVTHLLSFTLGVAAALTCVYANVVLQWLTSNSTVVNSSASIVMAIAALIALIVKRA